MNFGQHEINATIATNQPDTVRRARPLRRRALITRRPVAVLMRARKPDVRLRLRLVPSRVRFVIGLLQWCRLQQKVTVYNHTLNS